MDKKIIINKSVDLGLLTAECKIKSAKVTGLSLNAGTDLIVYGADDLTDADVLAVVSAHVVPVKVDARAKLKNDIDASPLTPATKDILNQLVDLR